METKTSLTQVFQGMDLEQYQDLLDGCCMEQCEASVEKRALRMVLRFFRVPDREKLARLRLELMQRYAMRELSFVIKMDRGLLGEGYTPYLLSYLKDSIACCGGFFNDCTVLYEGNKITFELKHGGGDWLEEQGICRKVEKLLERQFDEKFTVSLSGVLKNDPGDEKPFVPPVTVAPPAPKKETKAAGGQAVQEMPGGRRLIKGKEIKKPATKISELTSESYKVAVEGTVFRTESREIKNNTLLVFTFDMTDYESSVRVSSVYKIDEGKRIAAEITEGKRLLVHGDVEFNRFEKDIVIKAYDIMELPPVEVLDTAEEKRIELHLHTNMSSMDGLNAVSDYIKQAKKWGHPAIAVTDHGVVQSFPEAMQAGKKNAIKIIYGVEGYFVNDTTPTVYGRDETPMDGEFIVFDIETTGLSPKTCGITEIGAVKVKNGEILDSFNTFVNPERPIPPNIVELTGITDQMVKDAPLCDAALEEFFAFCGSAPLIAHNATFDMGFVKHYSAVYGLCCNNAYLDTLPLARYLYPELKRFKLDVLAKHLDIPEFSHHRACDDAKALAYIFLKMREKLTGEHGITNLSQINTLLAGNFDFKKSQTFHQIILAKNKAGMKNLYKLISISHLDYFYRRPRILKSVLQQHREGLLLGSACDAGELYTAILEGKSQSEIEKIAGFYDYLEIQPLGNTMHLVNSRRVESIEELKNINRTIVALGEKLHKPVVATGDVHFFRPQDEVFRRVLMAGQGFSDADNQAPLYFRTTQDMLNEFAYLGEEKAREVVIKNPKIVADWCEELVPISPDKCPPTMENAPEDLERMTWGKAYEIYGNPLPPIVEERVKKELDSIIGNGYSVMYMIAQKLVQKSLSDGYLVGSRGSVGSSLVAYLSGITEVNSLCPHYVCPNCRHSEFITDASYKTGADMPDKICPECGTKYKKDGFDIPFETFLGFKGDKEPDIDLNFSGDYQATAHKYVGVLFGEKSVFKAGTIGTLADKTAYGYVKKYLEERGRVVSKAEETRLTVGCTGIKRTTGQHPGGIIVCPKDREIYDFCPVQHPADDPNSDIITTHFDYHSIDKNLLKLDILGHDDPTAIRMLEDLIGKTEPGFDARKIPLDDPETMSLFTSNKALHIEPDDIITSVGSIGIPEFGTPFARQMLEDTKPTTFIELVNIAGLAHGTDVWLNNAADLVRDQGLTLFEVICTRDDIMGYLIHKGLEKKLSFDIMESVRKGKGLKDEWIEEMKAHDVPDWYIASCKKIKYMFPKAHAVAYVTMAFRIAYCKVHYPEAFYATYFTVRADEFDAQYMIHGVDVIKNKIQEINRNPEATAKEKNMVTILEVCYEMNKRGIAFTPIDLYRSDPVKFQITDEGWILPPLNALAGLGENAARSIAAAREEGQFASIEDLQRKAKVPKSVIEIMEQSGVLDGMDKSSQMSFF